MVVHVCNFSYSVGSWFKTNQGKKVNKNLILTSKLSVVVCTYGPSYRESIDRRITDKNTIPYQKNNYKKK
jgi:hypothetical protein